MTTYSPEKWKKLYAGGAGTAILALALSGPALAQDEGADAADEQIEEITVTGSRLLRTGFETPSPVVMIGEDEMAMNSAPALGDLLNSMPQLRGTFGLSNSSRFIGTAGIGALDLRGLGTERTLVLVNGRRHVSASAGAQIVDVNSIPSDMVERVEIITGANSAVYGADAVAGVVNFILKDDFEGVSLTASGGDADDTSFSRSSMSFTFGKNFDEGRGNALFSASYAEQDMLTAGERGGVYTGGWGRVPNPDDGDYIDENGIQVDDGIPDTMYVPNYGHYWLSEAGSTLDLGGRLLPNGQFEAWDPGSWEYLNGIRCGGTGCNSLDLESFQVLQVGFERITADANFTYDLSDDLTWYWESKYSKVDSDQQGQPSFDFFAPLGIARDNAYVTPSLAAAMDDAGASYISINRFNTDLGLRMEDDTRSTFRAVTGLKGDIGDSNYSFDVFANYGRTKIERVNYNDRINDRWYAAVDAVEIDAAGAGALQTSGLMPAAAAGDIVCRSTLEEAQGIDTGVTEFAYVGCVPANIVGWGMISDEAKAFINHEALGTSELEQTQIAATISNAEIVEAWAGPVGAVLGVEYREEKSKTIGDSLSQLDLTFFNALADTVGVFDVTEFFGEASLPLLRDVTMFQDLTLEGAIRYSDYSTIGNTTTWEARLNWQPIEDLRFRFNKGEALRAPTIDDLFAPAGQNYNIVNDPCDFENLDAGRGGRALRIANCQALGIADPANFDSNDEQSIELLQGGNPALMEETAETFTIGAVYTPSWAENLSIAIDYYDIEITDAISFTGSQAILDRCVDDLSGINNQFCSLVTRDSEGHILLLRNFPLNLNAMQTNGIDFEIDYSIEIGRFGTLQNRFVGSYLDERKFLLNSDDDVDIVEGELGDPKWQVNFGTTWLYENWTTFLELRWIDEMYLFEQETLFGSATNPDPNPDIANVTVADSTLYVDLGLTYEFENGFSVAAIIDNVTDEDPPFPLFGNGGQSGIYDSIGRFYTIRASYTFGD